MAIHLPAKYVQSLESSGIKLISDPALSSGNLDSLNIVILNSSRALVVHIILLPQIDGYERGPWTILGDFKENVWETWKLITNCSRTKAAGCYLLLLP